MPPLRVKTLVRSVGDRIDGGQVTTWWAVDAGRVGITVAHATGISVEISPADAARLRDHLSQLLDHATAGGLP